MNVALIILKRFHPLFLSFRVFFLLFKTALSNFQEERERKLAMKTVYILALLLGTVANGLENVEVSASAWANPWLFKN